MNIRPSLEASLPSWAELGPAHDDVTALRPRPPVTSAVSRRRGGEARGYGAPGHLGSPARWAADSVPLSKALLEDAAHLLSGPQQSSGIMFLKPALYCVLILSLGGLEGMGAAFSRKGKK